MMVCLTDYSIDNLDKMSDYQYLIAIQHVDAANVLKSMIQSAVPKNMMVWLEEESVEHNYPLFTEA